ncbi:MAG: flagellar basal body rod protein FlgC [Micavibrio sp.]|nr:flagellar basal body rod protein FlgC [Micavibrio sp.]
MAISSHGMRAQGSRVRVIAENLANKDTGPTRPGEDPYIRQVITFENEMDKNIGSKIVKVKDVEKVDKEQFVLKYMPDHPAADDQGYVRMPNINSLIEMMDMREATRSYEANLGMVEQSRDMMLRTIDMIR